ncbi:MAG TPA: gephyrin-like molybdotransferase Glp, partial [Isosphaeraceae bacterium]|nr:gephyrin-like molybdotransferase Glp [Isosphaeraceae bacterium]
MPDEIPPPVAPSDDPRMHGSRTRTSVDEAIVLIDRRVGPLPAETVDFRGAAGRVLAEAVRAAEPVPAFDRAAMDGYAIRGEETFGAGPYRPAAFRRAGDARPGRRCEVQVGPGEAVQITTGSALPTGADAVVKVESTRAEGDSILVFEATPPGRHVGRRGEDIAAGTIVLPAGRVLRPQDLGALSAVAARSIAVIRRPSVAVLVTGDELLEPGTPARGVQIADVNSVMLAALIARDGGSARVVGPLPDDRARLRDEFARAAAGSDLVLISGGTSAGPEDYAPGLVAELGELAVHGVALRPASPAGIGFLGAVPVVLLPGNPVSCLCAYDFFAGPIVRRLGGRPRAWPYRALVLPLAKELVSVVGRVDYARVRIEQGQVEPLAISGASILSSTTRADG